MISSRFLLATVTASVAAASAMAQTSKIVLGKLGQATNETAIHTQPKGTSPIYYRVKAYQYLVIQRTRSSAWTKVVMSNGVYGYVPTSAVAQLPYEVTAKAPARSSNRTLLASRGGGSEVANYALNFVGTPYKWGGNDVNNGIDCSGFVKKMYGTIGQSLPRTAAEQAMVGQPISRLEDLTSGDRLYFWDAKRGKIGHTGIYLGNGYFVHASSGRGGVATDYLGTQRWLKILVGARR